MKRKTIFLVTLLGLILSFGLIGSGWAVETEDSVYDWGPWGKMVTPAAGPSVPTVAVGGAGGFEFNPTRPTPVPNSSRPPLNPPTPKPPGQNSSSQRPS